MSRFLLNNTKIICTIGPSSQSRKIIKDLILAGMRGARLNFSHGNYKHHQLLIDNIRQASKNLNMPCAIIQDLQGPKMRIGILREPVEISKGEEILLVKTGNEDKLLKKENFKIIPIQYNLSSGVQKGDTILIDDGLIELIASQVCRDYVKARVRNSGTISSNKGLNVPGREMRVPVITAKDKEDLQFGLKANVDAVALSFVESAEDIKYLKRLINQ
ncbi:MAG: pyruvate kinase, partial [Patescibacteria group bacterium]